MAQNITFPYLLLHPPEKVFLDKDKIIFYKGDEIREIFFKKIIKIKVQSVVVPTTLALLYLSFSKKIPPLELNQTKPTWWRWVYYKLNDLTITTNTGEHLKMYNITISGTDELLSKAKNFNPTLIILIINKTPFFNDGCVTNGLIRIRGFELVFKILILLLCLLLFFVVLFIDYK